MATWELGYVPSLQLNPLPGVYTSGGNSLSSGFVPALTANAENTALDFEYFAYDRYVFASRAGVAFPGRWGSVVWQQDDIHELGAGPTWGVAHTVTGMSGDLDFGKHTGLYKFYGADGRAYLGGFYRGSTANETGAVIYDYETGAWTSWTTDLGHASFDAATYPIAWRGRLLLATEGRIYSLDPVDQRLFSFASGKTSDPTDKLFILGNRLFLAGKSGSSMSVWEVGGGGATLWNETVLSAFPRTSGGDFAVVTDYERAAIFWRGTLIPGVGPPPDFTFDTYHRWFSIELSSDEFLSGITTTDHTFTSQGSLAGGVIPLTSTRAVGFQEAEPGFFSAPQSSSARFIWVGSSAATAAAHPQTLGDSTNSIRTIEPVDSGTIGGSVGTGQADASHVSNRYGGNDAILNRDKRSEDYKVEPHPSVAGALRIHYYAHSASGTPTQSVRLYYRPRSAATAADALGSPYPTTAGTIIGADGTGTINVNGKQVDSVPYPEIGGSRYLDWDRVADLGADFDPYTPFRLVADDPGNLPAV